VEKLSEEIDEPIGGIELDSAGTQKTFQMTEKALLSTGIRVGTQVKTKSMANFVQRTRSDGLHVIAIGKTLARIEVVAKFLSRFEVNRVVVYSSREYAKTPIEKFCEITGFVPLTGRFMPGTFSNTLYPKHIDPEVILITDPAMDLQAVVEASKICIPTVSLCDTDNVTSNIDLVIPANNRGRKALAAVFWLLARSILTNQGQITADNPIKYSIEDFETRVVEEDEE